MGAEKAGFHHGGTESRSHGEGSGVKSTHVGRAPSPARPPFHCHPSEERDLQFLVMVMTAHNCRLFAILALASFLLVASASAETSISGIVTDPDGALVANQEVVITNTQTHKKVTVETGKEGAFGPVSLSSGQYRLDIRAQCFKHYGRTVDLVDGQHARIAAKLVLSCPKNFGPSP